LHAKLPKGQAFGCKSRDSESPRRRPAGKYVREPPAMTGAGNRDDRATARQQPGEGQLRRGATLDFGKLAQSRHELEVAAHILLLKTRHAPARIAVLQVFATSDGPGQKAAAERAIGHKADAQPLAETEDFPLDITTPQ